MVNSFLVHGDRGEHATPELPGDAAVLLHMVMHPLGATQCIVNVKNSVLVLDLHRSAEKLGRTRFQSSSCRSLSTALSCKRWVYSRKRAFVSLHVK